MPKGVSLKLTGKKFTRLLVLKQLPNKGRHTYWLCKCDCGSIVKVMGCSLKNGEIKSCGCYKRDQIILRSTKHGHGKRGQRTREYRAWKAMKNRCLNTNQEKYKNYGARGISICDRWLSSYESFFEDMGQCPERMTLGRINNDGNYNPENCAWSTPFEQSRNTRRNVWLEHDGKTLCQNDWALLLGISSGVMCRYIKYEGKTIKDIINIRGL